jgi:hypothetical protein
MFENGECGHAGDRIVRIGTHTFVKVCHAVGMRIYISSVGGWPIFLL